MNSFVSRTSGLTLLEVVIAIAVIGVAFGVFASTQVTTMRVTAESRSTSDAMEYANQVLEQEVRALTRTPEAFSGAFVDCAGTCQTAIDERRFEGSVTVVPESAAAFPDAPGFERGLLLVTAELVRPARVSFSRYVSCLDVNPAPTVAGSEPGPELCKGGS